MSALQQVAAYLAILDRELEDLDERFERRGAMDVGAWQRDRRTLVAQREVLSRSRHRPQYIAAEIEQMSEGQFIAWSQQQASAWEAEALQKIEACDEIRNDARAAAARLAVPPDWHRTFRGIDADAERAREVLSRCGAFGETSRLIAGVASTSEANSHLYSVDPLGCEAETPLPLLLRHDWTKVIGEVTRVEFDKDAVRFEARVSHGVLPLPEPSYDFAVRELGYSKSETEWARESPKASDLDLDAIWQQITSGELAGISADSSHLGGLQYEANGVRRFARWRMAEISVCSRGAHPGARILTVMERTGATSRVLRRAGAYSTPARHPASIQKLPLSEAQRIEERIAALESRPAMRYRGVWSANEHYDEGDFVTRRGSIWACLCATRDAPPSPNWQLAVKRGTDGRDADK